jgi:hypothetical protein
MHDEHIAVVSLQLIVRNSEASMDDCSAPAGESSANKVDTIGAKHCEAFVSALV